MFVRYVLNKYNTTATKVLKTPIDGRSIGFKKLYSSTESLFS